MKTPEIFDISIDLIKLGINPTIVITVSKNLIELLKVNIITEDIIYEFLFINSINEELYPTIRNYIYNVFYEFKSLNKGIIINK